MKISVITTVLNGIDTIRDTIESVSKNFNDYEHIIIDAGSTDGTKEYINSLKNVRVYINDGISIPDAWNLGIQEAKGDYIGILNSDDYYGENIGIYINGALESDKYIDILIGNVVLINFNKNKIRTFNGKKPTKFNMIKGMPFLHPSVFVRRHYYFEYGLFKKSRRIGFDAEWLLGAYKNGGKFSTHKGITYMRSGGISESNKWVGFGEYLQSLSDLKYAKVYILSYLFFKIATSLIK